MSPDALARLLRQDLPDLEIKTGNAVAALDPGTHPDNLKAGVIALPASPAEVSALLRLCTQHAVAVVPQGGRTGLAAAAVSTPGQVILSTARLNRVVSIDPAARLAVVEAGVTLATLRAAAGECGLSPGIDLGARDSATIGGMISTNAGGIEAFRHGVMRQRVVGLEAVLADGTVMGDMATVSKCNEGYDVKQLFIGAEGTLGVVTRAVIRLAASPRARATALIAVPELATAVALFNALADGADLLAFELMNPRYFRLAAADRNEAQLLPLADAGYVFIIETAGFTASAAQSVLEERLAKALEQGQVADAIIAQSAAEARRFWLLREDSWVVDRAFPHALWFDVTVPLASLDPYLRRVDDDLASLAPRCQAFAIGHLGDGNLHLTLASPEDLTALKNQLSAIVYDPLKPLGGSFSAEHGIGLEKRATLQRYGDPGKRRAMLAVKAALDPASLMNPGKLF
jgi:FAD/FMN-containing dehydrogenase